MQAGPVAAEQTLATLQASDLQLREARAVARIGALDSRLLAVAAAQDLPESARSTRAQLAQQQVEVAGASAEARQLQLLAPFAGEVVDVAVDAVPGAVVSRQEPLGRVIDPSFWLAEIFVDEDGVKRLQLGAAVTAHVRGLAMETLRGRVEAIDTVPLDQLPAEMLKRPVCSSSAARSTGCGCGWARHRACRRRGWPILWSMPSASAWPTRCGAAP